MSEGVAAGADSHRAPTAGTPARSPSTSLVLAAPAQNPKAAPRWPHLRGLDVHALHRLPGAEDDDPYARLVAAWLLTLTSTHTTRAYATEASTFFRWCSQHDLHPFAAERWHLDAYRHWLTSAPTRTGRPRAAATISRALSALAGLYSHGVTLGVLTHSPVADVHRPRVAADSQSVALSAAELRAVMRAAEQHSPRAAALTSLLILTGIRIGEALAADVTDIGTDAGHRVLRITRKGGKRARVVLPAAAVRALEAYLAGRTSGPLFWNSPERTLRPWPDEDAGPGQGEAREAGGSTTLHEEHTPAGGLPADNAASPRRAERKLQRWQYGPASRLLAHLFTGVGVSDQATAHSFRHSWVTESLGLGVPLQDVQDAAGHADPRTTRRYDRARHHLDRHSTYALAGLIT